MYIACSQRHGACELARAIGGQPGRYQMRCIEVLQNSLAVHALIAQSTIQTHAIMQDCLDGVIALEQWDRRTLEMSVGLLHAASARNTGT